MSSSMRGWAVKHLEKRCGTVRGHSGTLFQSGTGYAVLWGEQGIPYVVLGRMEQEVLVIAEGLEELDQAEWQRRVQPQ
jgi:hypothetical protein